MATWSTRGLRGSLLEDMINYTIEHYRTKKLALIQKIPTPIKPINIEKETKHITLAYFDQKSTVDYIGLVQGVPVCFDAKECAANSFPLQNVHEHQMEFMKDFEAQGGLSFFLVYYTQLERIYFVSYETMKVFWERSQKGEKKSFHIDELMEYEPIEVKIDKGVSVRLLEALQIELDRREETSQNM